VVVKVEQAAVEILADLQAYLPRVEKPDRNENLPILQSLDEEDLDLELLVHNYNWSESKVTLHYVDTVFLELIRA
jgi:hypothetical protein